MVSSWKPYQKEMVTNDTSLVIGSTSSYSGLDSASIPAASSAKTNVLSSLSRFRNRLGTEMNEIIPNLYLGSLRDAVDVVQLKKNRIQYIVSVHDLSAQHPSHEHLKVLRIQLSDCSSVDIAVHFSTTNQFIHSARLKRAAVLVHCLAGVSRSATVVAAYLITVCDISFPNALTFISKKRPVVNPNFGFRMQLCTYAERFSMIERQRLRDHFGTKVFDAQFAEDRAAICFENELQSTISPSTVPTSASNQTSIHITSNGGSNNMLIVKRNPVHSPPEPPIRKVIAKTLPLPEIRRVEMATLVHNPAMPEIGYIDE